MGLPWSVLGLRAVSLLVVALISAGARLDDVPVAFRLVHIAIGAVVGLGFLGSFTSAMLGLYLWTAAIALNADDPAPQLTELWKLYKVAAPPCILLAILGPCCCRSRKSRWCCGATCAVLLAFAAHIGFLLVPTFIAEDAFPVSTPTLVETPGLRADYCGPERSLDPPPAHLRYICEGIEPLSWEEAQARAEESLAQMSMRERHSLMQGIGWQAFPPGFPLPLPAIPKRGYYMGNTPPIPRLGVPALKLHDAGNGFRNNPPPVGKPFTTVMWPSSLAFGATWNPALVEKVAGAIGREYRGKGANVILGPSVQVQRVPRNGRNFEYMSGEDPYLGARLAEAYVKGVQREGVIACLKHYGFNEQETIRNGGNFVVDERTAWEIYYPPFEAGVAAGAGSVMCSYNKINGTFACASENLLARDLKKKMGFKGFVMSDWWALHDPPTRSVVRGFDQEMPGAGSDTRFHAEELVKMEETQAGDYKGELGLTRERVYKDAAFRVLSAIWKMRLGERPGCMPGKDCVAAIESNQVSKENEELAREAATQSVILLKNSGALPVDPRKVRTLAIVGAPLNATSLTTAEAGMSGDYYSGGGSGHCYVEKESLRTPLQGLTERAGKLGIRVVSSPTNDVNPAVEASKAADLTLVLAATTAEEGKDRDNLSLDFGADMLISALASRPVVVLAQVPGTVLMPWRDQVEAIAMMFLGGEKTSHAWEAVVFGDVSPTGKLPIQLPKGMEGVIEPQWLEENHYGEGLFSSYRARNAKEVVAFPFGHGLSYTNFSYSAPVLLPAGECKAHACATLRVTNTGGREGAEVAQAYVAFPKESEEPDLVLRGFQRTKVLQPGQGEDVTFSFTARDFSIYVHGGWQLQSGIVLHVGASSLDVRHTLPLSAPAA